MPNCDIAVSRVSISYACGEVVTANPIISSSCVMRWTAGSAGILDDGDTRHPNDKGNYLDNVASTVKRIRNHPLAYYVASNESTEVTGTPELLNKLDGTRGYQMQSECAGVHDGSPYKQVNPMQHYEKYGISAWKPCRWFQSGVWCAYTSHSGDSS